MPVTIDLETAISEFNASEKIYRQKLANMLAAARAALAASPEDAGVSRVGPGETVG